MRVDEAEREVEVLRDDLAQAQNRITTLLEMNQPGFQMEGDYEDGAGRRDSMGSSEEASMAFDKVSVADLSTSFGSSMLTIIPVLERAQTMERIRDGPRDGR